MSEAIQALRDHALAQQILAGQRRNEAASQFAECRDIAQRHGVALRQCSESHYQLRAGQALLNVYPGSRRLARDPKHQTEHISLQIDWDLLDVVAAFVAKYGKANQ